VTLGIRLIYGKPRWLNNGVDMLNIFRKFQELQEIKFELPRIEARLQRIEWIIRDMHPELEALNKSAEPEVEKE
jgi:hypothetical protein